MKKNLFIFSLFYLLSLSFSSNVLSSVKAVQLNEPSTKDSSSKVNVKEEKLEEKVKAETRNVVKEAELTKEAMENQVVVYYNMQDVAEKLEVAKEFQKELETEFNDRAKSLEKDIKDLDAKGKELEKKKDVLSKEAMEKEMQDLFAKRYEVGAKDEALKRDYEKKMRDFSERIQVVINDAVSDYINQKGHEYYFITAAPSSAMVNNAKYNVTNSIIKIANEKHSKKSNKTTSEKNSKNAAEKKA